MMWWHAERYLSRGEGERGEEEAWAARAMSETRPVSHIHLMP